MLTIPLNKLSQATAAAALGVAMIATVGTAPASAVNLKTFNLSGTFASSANPGAVPLATDLAGGSFDGTYEVDVDKLPYDFLDVDFTAWNVNLRNSANAILTTFSNSQSGSLAQITSVYPGNSILFFSPSLNLNLVLALSFNSGFTGAGTGLQIGINDDNQPIFGTLAKDVNSPGIGVTSATSSAKSGGGVPVPEPITMSGMVLGSAIGLLMKRKQKASQSA